MVGLNKGKTSNSWDITNSEVKNKPRSKRKFIPTESQFYLFEYLLFLLLVAVLLIVVQAMAMLFSGGVSNSIISIYYGRLGLDIMLVSLSVVILPLIAILAVRTGNSEKNNLLIKNNIWHKAVLGVFLMVTSIWAIFSTVSFTNVILEFLSSGIETKSAFDWKKFLIYFFTSIFLVIVIWVFISDYQRSASKPESRNIRTARRGLFLTVVIIVLLFIFFPLRTNRGVLVDNTINEDILRIQEAVNNYTNKTGALPDGLNDIGLSAEQTARANTFGYTYEKKSGQKFVLCAVFKTDSQKDYYSGIQSSEAVAPLPYTDSGVYAHRSGLDCFDFSTDLYTDGQSSVEGANSSASEDSPVQDSPDFY